MVSASPMPSLQEKITRAYIALTVSMAVLAVVAFTDALNRMLREQEIRQKRMLQAEKPASLGILSAGVAPEPNNPTPCTF